jgi:hypothetical protein
MAAELNVDPMTVRSAMHENFGLKSYTRTMRHLLTESMKARRLKRCKKVLSYLKNNGDIVKLFSNKKIFTVDAICNCHND